MVFLVHRLRQSAHGDLRLPCFVRAYFLGLERQAFSSKEISDLMRFIDTDVNFTLDLEEMRWACTSSYRHQVANSGSCLRLVLTRINNGGGPNACTRILELPIVVDRTNCTEVLWSSMYSLGQYEASC